MPRAPQPVGADQPERLAQLAEFRQGLLPILLAGDVDRFRRYLRRWEELVGDTAELAETPEAQTRRTMAALLRRPEQYGLPPWPPAAPDPSPKPLAPGPAMGRDAVGARGPDRGVAPEPPGGDAEPAIVAGDGVYQIDMLTGELVPLDAHEIRATHQAHEPGPPARRRRQRRRIPPNLEQLPLWPSV